MSEQTENYPPAAADPARIPFGDGPCQDLPLNLASAVLRRVWAKSPAQFGAILKQAMIDTWAAPDPAQNGHRK